MISFHLYPFSILCVFVSLCLCVFVSLCLSEKGETQASQKKTSQLFRTIHTHTEVTRTHESEIGEARGYSESGVW